MARKQDSAWTFVENFEGDKVVLMIALLLTAMSILALSSSTPMLAIQEHTSRSAIIREHLFVAGLGLLVMIGVYNIRNIKWFRIVAKLGFVISFLLLILLSLHVDLKVVKAQNINHAYRSLLFFGKVPVHVFEVTKILMIMYIAWAVDAYKRDGFGIANLLAETKTFHFMRKDIWKKVMYIYLPILIVCGMVVFGSMSSALFIGVILGVTILVGGIKMKELVPLALLGALLLIGVLIYHKVAGEKDQSHIGTALNRIGRNPEKELAEAKNTAYFDEVKDRVRQPISAKIAVKEGGVIGKGAGKSTQRYVVPVMFSDYMLAFIVEEYGIMGALWVLSLYCSLVARSSLIVRNCNDVFGKTAVAGLVLLISGQAMLHAIVNVDLGPLTGQTLPMISHGNTSFLMFSLAFGIILSISRMTRKKVEKEIKAEPPIVQHDELYDGLQDLEEMENEQYENYY